MRRCKTRTELYREHPEVYDLRKLLQQVRAGEQTDMTLMPGAEKVLTGYIAWCRGEMPAGDAANENVSTGAV